MPNFTPNLDLIKPLGSENFSVSHANGNADKIDTAFGSVNEQVDKFKTRTTVSVWDYKDEIPNWQVNQQEVWDWEPAFAKAVEYLKSIGGGNIFCPSHTYGVLSSIELESNISIVGEWWTTTFIKALNNAVIPTNQAIVQTKDFLPNRNVWDYYKDEITNEYPTGLHMGVGLSNITIDGNRANQTTGNGLCIYGGKWSLYQVAVISTSEHGIWTECGVPVAGSFVGSDFDQFLNMHECTAEQVFISNTNKRGWDYRGANDSYINNVQIKATGWSAFNFPEGDFMNAGLKIGRLHAYGSNTALDDPDDFMINLKSAGVIGGTIFADHPSKNGVRLGAASLIDSITVLNHNFNASDEYWGVVFEGGGTRVKTLKCNSNFIGTITKFDGGGVWVKSSADRCYVGDLYMYVANSTGIANIGALIEGTATNIANGSIMGLTSGTGLKVSSPDNKIDLTIHYCDIGFDYINTNSSVVNRNTICLSLLGCTIPTKRGIPYHSNERISIMQSGSSPMSYGNVTMENHTLVNVQGLDLAEKILPSNSILNLDDNKISFYLCTLDQNVTINATMASPRIGQLLYIRLAQGGASGGHTVTFNTSQFKTSYPNPDTNPGTLYKRALFTFIWDGAFWVESNKTGWL